MRYRLRTLLIVLAVVVSGMIALTAYGQWAVIVIGWTVLPVFFGLWYRMLLTSQANRDMRGERDQPWSL